MTAQVMLTAYKQRNTPLVEGKVVSVSADRITEPQTGFAYFLTRIHVDADAIAKLQAGIELYPGMPAEIACETTANLGFKNSVMPAHVYAIQPAVATGQIQPSANLLDMGAAAQNRGTVLVLFELKYKEHEQLLLDGSGCIVQTYTTNLHGFWGHVIATTAIIKAVGLRAKVLGAILAGVGLLGGGH